MQIRTSTSRHETVPNELCSQCTVHLDTHRRQQKHMEANQQMDADYSHFA
jgi:hypothetical protein